MKGYSTTGVVGGGEIMIGKMTDTDMVVDMMTTITGATRIEVMDIERIAGGMTGGVIEEGADMAEGTAGIMIVVMVMVGDGKVIDIRQHSFSACRLVSLTLSYILLHAQYTFRDKKSCLDANEHVVSIDVFFYKANST
ncbi:hypothetical protein J132_02375 [Termitomyces sp. J132]|nr:hypothetical protein H2248_002206 [Termitomyces sp. 'cryptogamus']KNZ81178.1 hypothetical protein J132_02375 [Termitomyces sp. J132]